MKFSNNKNQYIRWTILAVLVVLTAAFQHTRGAIPSIGGVRPMLLIPLVVAIAMFERSIAGMCFGLLAGVLWDVASLSGDGFYAILLTSVGFACGSLVTYLMRNNVFSAALLSFFSLAICTIGYFLMFIVRKGYDSQNYLLFRYYIPSIIYSMVFAFVYYYIVYLISKVTAPEKLRNTY